MANHKGTELFSYTSFGTVNALWANNLKDDTWTVFLVERGSESLPQAGKGYFWQEGIRTPEEFVEACLRCLAKANFGKADISDIYHLGGEQLQRFDKKFTRELKRYILEKYGKKKIGKYPPWRGIDSPGGVGRGDKPIKGRVFIGEGCTGVTLTKLETIRKYGASLTFVGSSFFKREKPATVPESAVSAPPGRRAENGEDKPAGETPTPEN